MNTADKLNELEEMLFKHGYDVLINLGNNTLTMLNDGWAKTVPLNNVLNMLNGCWPLCVQIPIKDIASMLMSNHKISKEINEGKYDNSTPMTKEDLAKIINDNLKKK